MRSQTGSGDLSTPVRFTLAIPNNERAALDTASVALAARPPTVYDRLPQS